MIAHSMSSAVAWTKGAPGTSNAVAWTMIALEMQALHAWLHSVATICCIVSWQGSRRHTFFEWGASGASSAVARTATFYTASMVAATMQHLYAHSCMCVKRHLDTNDMCLFLESVVCRFTCAKGVFRPSWLGGHGIVLLNILDGYGRLLYLLNLSIQIENFEAKAVRLCSFSVTPGKLCLTPKVLLGGLWDRTVEYTRWVVGIKVFEQAF